MGINAKVYLRLNNHNTTEIEDNLQSSSYILDTIGNSITLSGNVYVKKRK